MIHFGKISKQEFLRDYWQKKPLLIKQALPNFISPLSPDELAGLACEAEFESRIITGSTDNNDWHLSNGAFAEEAFADLPDDNWTLLVQGVDRYVDEVYHLVSHFDFIPRWRFDDVMISYAAKGGSVGPHFDFYDVFLLQGSGKRRWHISTENCTLDNYQDDAPLRIMKKFEAEVVWDAEPGDVVYVPPKVAHHGVSLDDDCMTLSIGYRSYSHQEMLLVMDVGDTVENTTYYQDPEWKEDGPTALIPEASLIQAQSFLEGVELPNDFFGEFVTKLDPMDEKNMNEISAYAELEPLELEAIYELQPCCRVAYQLLGDDINCYINGEALDCNNIDKDVIIDFCNTRKLKVNDHDSSNYLLASRLQILALIRRLRS
jgi:50S ribosomal protein L16 3-hydroxylase